jgi:hypothetical protein
MIVHHPESGISYCARHYDVVQDGRCATCEALPRPRLLIDPHAVARWQERMEPSLGDPVAAIQHIVRFGREVRGDGRGPGYSYYAHEDFEDAVVVVTNKKKKAAVITVLRADLSAQIRKSTA